ncbi:hypothetical protein E3N88_05564 [Mikania micrantha]|uniref:Uncharacterized protein n=1 Tax=Mikania micrantha TaxID=192012 RepID=A0A5N6PLB4_9ASTR|nr:hypothetical protein E3N88_05564 [Mikania micrantha]
MSVVGFDLGNESCVVAVARQRGIDVVLNDESKRETPAIVCFGEKQRFLGTAGAASSMMNPKNTISQIKRLIGRPFSDPELQQDLKALPFSVTEGPDGFPLIHAQYLGETKTFTPTQVMGMVFSNMKTIAEKNLNAAVVDCCIGIPVYFTDLQRRAVMDAATIAGLHPLRLMHETTATALAYGIYKTDLPENEQLNVAFIDIGHASMQVCIAGFKKGHLKILAHSFDRCLGGRDFDEVLFQHFAEKFKVEYKIDVFTNARACLRLRSRVPAVIKILTEFFGKEPRRTMNASECVSKGCALQCAILSPTFKVREFQVQESFPFTIALTWKGSAQDSQNGHVENQQSSIVFPKGNQIPSVKALTFYRTGTFTVDLQYADVSEWQALPKISTYTIGPFQATKGDRAKVKVKVRMNLHGIVYVESAQLIEEEEVEVPVSKEPEKMDIDKASAEVASINETDVNMQDAPVTENGAQETCDNPVQMEADAKVEAPKKKVTKSNIPVSEFVHGAMLPVDVQKAVEKEFEMALQDRVMEETKDKKNAVEAYVYDMRNKLYDKLNEFVTEPERETFIAKLQETEDWLYEDGEDETKGVYIAKLDELKKQGDPIEHRFKEHLERGPFVDQLLNAVNWYRQAAVSGDPKYDHIDLAEKQKVLNECSEVENWLRESKQLQDSLPKHAEPVLLSSDVRKKAETLDRVCRPIMSKPKPAPPKPSTPEKPSSPAPTQEDEQPSSQAENATSPNPSAENDENSDAPAAMETEKPDGAA